LLSAIPELAPLDRLDRAWIFPPRLTGEVETGLVVVSLWPAEKPEADEREVVTIRYEQRQVKNRTEGTREVLSRGWAPSQRVPGVIDGVVRRLGEEGEEPWSGDVTADIEKWNRLVGEVSDGMVDVANGE